MNLKETVYDYLDPTYTIVEYTLARHLCDEANHRWETVDRGIYYDKARLCLTVLFNEDYMFIHTDDILTSSHGLRYLHEFRVENKKESDWLDRSKRLSNILEFQRYQYNLTRCTPKWKKLLKKHGASLSMLLSPVTK